jgi:hypothetical protein
MGTIGDDMRNVVGWMKLVLLAYALSRLEKLDCMRRIAAALGFVCGAAIEARNLGMAVAAHTIAEWIIFGCLLTAVLFHHEINHLLR